MAIRTAKIRLRPVRTTIKLYIPWIITAEKKRIEARNGFRLHKTAAAAFRAPQAP
jgi:hypothetical protein